MPVSSKPGLAVERVQTLNVLLSNDDGFFAPGLKALATTLEQFGEVMVAAPDRERSAVGHGITVHQPLRIQEKPLLPGMKRSFMTSGTPADCVKLAVQGLQWQPDVVVSGINRGANLGTDVLYSGTVSAALEGLLLGFPAIAVSLCGHDEDGYTMAAEVITRLLKNDVLPLKPGALYNINVPVTAAGDVPKYRFTRQGTRIYDNIFERRQDPRGVPYFWLGGKPLPTEEDPEVDLTAIADGCVSITPLQPDLTNYGLLRALRAGGNHSDKED